MRTGVYVRISADRVGEGVNVATQQADCRRLAERNGWTVHQVYEDNDISAYSGRVRPAYQQLLADIEAGTIQAVVAWHTDRLHRSPKELEAFIDLVEAHGVAIETVTTGPVDLATPSGRAVARTLGAWARYESEHKSERVRRKHLQIASAGGLSGGGTRPFGFEQDRLTVIPAEADEIRWAAAQILAGRSARSICNDWHQRGVKTPTGLDWSYLTLRRMMTSWRIAGIRSLKGEPVADAVWPAIIDRATLERVRAILLDPNRRTTVTVARRYPLRPLVRCADCTSQMFGRPREDGARRYICPPGPYLFGCGRVIMADPLEAMVRDLLAVALDDGRLAKALDSLDDADKRREELFSQLLADEKALNDAYNDWRVDGITTRQQYLQAKKTLEARIDATRRDLRAAETSPTLHALPASGETLKAEWDAADVEWKAALVGRYLERIEIGAGVRGLNRFDPRRVQVVWGD